MEVELKIVPGPLTEGFSREAAVEKLETLRKSESSGFPKDAKYEIYEANGRYMAAVAWPKEAGPFPPSDEGEVPGGPPSDEAPSEESGPPKEEDEKDKDDEPSSEGAPGEEGKKPSVEHQLANLTDMVTKITDALGLSTPADGMVPGADEGPPGGPPGLEEGPPSGPPGADGGGGPDKKIMRHERSMKPGEAPPGTTPVSAPSFASVQVEEGHPWKDAIESGAKEFEVYASIGEKSISAVATELKELAEPYGLVVTDLAPDGTGASRTASARIVRTR